MANIYFKKIILNNFMSYEYADVKLDIPGYILVNGENNNPDDLAKSNGCGKSTIFNAISWVLTGQTTSGSKDVSNIYIEGETFVEITFECNNNEYILKRSKNPSNLKIYINNEDKSGKGIRDTEKLLIEYLPEITESLINSVIILGQGLPQRFTNNTPAGRKEVLETLSKSDFMIDDIKQRLNNRKTYLSGELRKYEDTLLQNNNSLSMYDTELNSVQSQLNALPDENELIEEKNNLEDKYKVICDEIQEYDNNIENCQNIINKLTDELLNIQNDKEKAINDLDLVDIQDLTKLISETEAELNIKTSEFNKLKNVTDICPTCGQKLPNVTKIDTTQLEQDLDVLKSSLNDYKLQYESVKKENDKKIQDIQAEYKLKIDVMKFDINDYTTSKDSYYTKQSVLSKDKTTVYGELNKCITTLDSINRLQTEYKSRINELVSKIDDIKLQNVVIETMIQKYQTYIDINQKMSIIVKRDFRGYLLTNVIDFIATRCSYYAGQVFGNNCLSFKLDGNNVSIAYDNKEYELLSGGEKQKVDVILQLSIRDMLCSYLNFSSNILVLDEITDSLDSVGAQKIFNLISNNLSDVETIFIISHHTDFEIPYDDEIKIIKGDDKISRII